MSTSILRVLAAQACANTAAHAAPSLALPMGQASAVTCIAPPCLLVAGASALALAPTLVLCRLRRSRHPPEPRPSPISRPFEGGRAGAAPLDNVRADVAVGCPRRLNVLPANLLEVGLVDGAVESVEVLAAAIVCTKSAAQDVRCTSSSRQLGWPPRASRSGHVPVPDSYAQTC